MGNIMALTKSKVSTTSKKAASTKAAPKKGVSPKTAMPKTAAVAKTAAAKEKSPGQVALDKKLAAEEAAKQAALESEAEFAARCSGKVWRITMTEMPKAMRKAEEEMRTPLLLDATPHHAVDTFWSYRSAQIIEGKKLVLQGRDAPGLADVMEESRARLILAMAHGYTLYLRMTNCAADVIGKYDVADCLPAAVWNQDVVQQALEEDVMELPDHPLKSVVRDADCREHGAPAMFFVHKDFRVVVCSHLSVEDYEEFLVSALPLDKMQVIVVEDGS